MPARPTQSKIPNFKRLSSTVRRTANRALIDLVGEWAEGQKDDFRAKIERQDFPDFHIINYPESGTNLSPMWLARKSKAGADDRTMIATGWYKDHIRVWRTLRPGRRGADWRIGFHHRVLARDLNHRPISKTLNYVAAVHEYGSSDGRIPRRRHWGPFNTIMRKRAVEERPKLRRKVLQALRAAVSDQMKVKVS
jgi:hypothetical protein